MQNKVNEFVGSIQDELIKFTQDLIKIKSFTCDEENIAQFIRDKMLELGYDDVIMDKLGNVIGVIGNGETKILYDSHIDTVDVKDANEWTMDPFGGEIKDGKLYGRGAVDMKSAVAATVYAGYAIKKLGLDKGKTIYISTSVAEEDYDGEALYYLLTKNNFQPNYIIICEPSRNQISLGHKGRALFKVSITGVSAHGSTPEKGVNAIYEMNTIISRVEELGEKFIAMGGNKGSLALTKIESTSASLNAIPQTCSIYLDRRLTIGDDWAFIKKEMEHLLEGTNATWEIYKAIGTSWTGEPIVLNSFLPAWEIDLDHNLTLGCINAFKQIKGTEPELFKWNFTTNAAASVKLGIPTIGFGPGDYELAHMTDENCSLSDIIDACAFYTTLPNCL